MDAQLANTICFVPVTSHIPVPLIAPSRLIGHNNAHVGSSHAQMD